MSEVEHVEDLAGTADDMEARDRLRSLIKKAMEDYEKTTGIDPSEENPFAAAIRSTNPSEAILKLLQEREGAFRDYLERYRTLIGYLIPVVNGIQTFSGILGDTVSLVSLTCHLVTLLT